MTMALMAQTVIHQFRSRLGAPFATWDAQHLAWNYFRGLEGDIRVKGDTILVTYYNAPMLSGCGRNTKTCGQTPGRKRRSAIPWLYGFQLDFRFR